MARNNFRGMPGGMNQAAMLKQAQKMQQDMLRMQEEMENKKSDLQKIKDKNYHWTSLQNPHKPEENGVKCLKY